MTRSKPNPLLGQILVREMGLDESNLDRALQRQADLAAHGRYYLLGRILLGLGYVSLEQLEAALERQSQASVGSA